MLTNPLDRNGRTLVGSAAAGINQVFQNFSFERVLDTFSIVYTYLLFYIFYLYLSLKAEYQMHETDFFQRWTHKPQKHCSSNPVNHMEIFHNLDEPSEVHLTQRNPPPCSFKKL